MKKGLTIFIVVAVVIFIVALLLPFLLSWIAGKGFQAVQEYKLPDLLSYYGSVLVFIGTSSLAIISLIQNKRNQEKTNRINELTLELQKKTMQFAEYQYNKDQSKEEKYPEFEVTLLSHQGDLTGCKMTVKNVSNVTAKYVKSVDLCVYDSGGFKKGETTDVSLSSDTINPNESIDVHTGLSFRDIPENCYIYWGITCETDKGKPYYYNMNIYIPEKGERPVTEKADRVG